MANPESTHRKSTRIQVMLADPHRLATWGIRQLIQSRAPTMEVVGSCHDADDVPALSDAVNPDVVVIHVGLCANAGQLVKELLSRHPVQILLLSDEEGDAAVDSAILAGARGVVGTREPVDTLLRAIEKIHAGELWLDRGNTARLFDRLARSASTPPDPEVKLIEQLTRREREIVRALAESSGARNRELARQLKMSEHTLRNHLCSIYDKLGLDGRLQLYAFARKHREVFVTA